MECRGVGGLTLPKRGWNKKVDESRCLCAHMAQEHLFPLLQDGAEHHGLHWPQDHLGSKGAGGTQGNPVKGTTRLDSSACVRLRREQGTLVDMFAQVLSHQSLHLL